MQRPVNASLKLNLMLESELSLFCGVSAPCMYSGGLVG
jgi:hypothetical protein